MVFQRPVLLRRSAIDNVVYRSNSQACRATARRVRALEALARVGLATLANRPARVMSGGEQQRLALARAWVLRPEVLVSRRTHGKPRPRRNPRNRTYHRRHA